MKITTTKEVPCVICGGSGLARVRRPAKPGRRIYPPNCKACGGRGQQVKDGRVAGRGDVQPLSVTNANFKRKCCPCLITTSRD